MFDSNWPLNIREKVFSIELPLSLLGLHLFSLGCHVVLDGENELRIIADGFSIFCQILLHVTRVLEQGIIVYNSIVNL